MISRWISLVPMYGRSMFSASFDAVLADAGIEAVKIPRGVLARTPMRSGSCSPPD